LKLIGNGMIMGANELLAETLTFGEKSGIGQQTVYDLIKGEHCVACCPTTTVC
jgi:3-hydroxyisobutyrate dehydrogenase-like beta-hydroxyacid dehydrogenase